MKNLRSVLFVVLLIITMVSVSACKKEPTLDEIWNSKVDQQAVSAFNDKVNATSRKLEAEMKGDGYCSKCDRFIPGKVRICPNCGQYI